MNSEGGPSFCIQVNGRASRQKWRPLHFRVTNCFVPKSPPYVRKTFECKRRNRVMAAGHTQALNSHFDRRKKNKNDHILSGLAGRFFSCLSPIQEKKNLLQEKAVDRKRLDYYHLGSAERNDFIQNDGDLLLRHQRNFHWRTYFLVRLIFSSSCCRPNPRVKVQKNSRKRKEINKLTRCITLTAGRCCLSIHLYPLTICRKERKSS